MGRGDRAENPEIVLQEALYCGWPMRRGRRPAPRARAGLPFAREHIALT